MSGKIISGKKALYSCLLVLALYLPCFSWGPANERDSLALIAFYYSTDGDNWKDNTYWLDSVHVTGWYGIDVHAGQVIEIDLSNNNLNGSIPTEIGNIRYLKFLLLSNNNLSGAIPDTLASLSRLEHLIISDNNFNSLPNLSSLPLSKLEVQNNQLTFEDLEYNINIPGFLYAPQDSVGRTVDTTIAFGDDIVLSVNVGGTANQYQWMKDGTDIEGASASTYTISSADVSDAGAYICKITNSIVNDLTLYSRQFKLQLKDFFESDSLALVVLYNSCGGDNWTNKTNWLSAQPLSTWYGVTVYGNRVARLDLENNNLAGAIPKEIGELTELTHLNLRVNQLEGALPESIGNLVRLIELNLEKNSLSGLLPETIGNLSSLKYLYLKDNNLSGEIPASVGKLTQLRKLYLHNNNFSGLIPNHIGNLTNLGDLRLYNNRLSGALPDSLGNMENLNALYLHRNQFTGKVPSSLVNLAKLQTLYLSDNQLDSLPDFSTAAMLSKLHIENNLFTFEDIVPNLGVNGFVYIPQKNVGDSLDVTLTEGDSLLLSVSVGGSANSYQWMKDSVDISGATDSIFVVTIQDTADAGVYICKVTNNLVLDLTIYSKPVTISVDFETKIERNAAVIPKRYLLRQNYPNPFNPSTTICYELPKTAYVTINIYNTQGKNIAALVEKRQQPGRYLINWNAADYSSGVYFIRFMAGDYYSVKKTILLK